MNKIVKNIITVSSVLVLVIATAGYVIGNFFYELALDPSSDKSTVIDAEHNQVDRPDGGDGSLEQIEQEREWFRQTDKENKYLVSHDKLRLHAYQIENRVKNDKWVIICHGYTSKADFMSGAAKRFYDMDYNVLIPDARGHGQSEGDYIGMGWDDRLDIVRWIDMIIEENPDAEIILYGVSMGGATVMMTSGEDLPDNVKAIVEDCGYSSVKGEFSYQLKELFGFPAFPVIDFASIVTKLRAGYFLGDGDAIKQVAKSKTPMLFIHGADDTFVPASMLDEVYEAARVPKEKLLIPSAGHGGASSVNPDLYWATIRNFIGKYVS